MNAEGTVRINPDIENEKKLTTIGSFKHFIFNRQHKVQKSRLTFLG
jgi:hypothetical protein